jgi:hypothetical protein
VNSDKIATHDKIVAVIMTAVATGMATMASVSATGSKAAMSVSIATLLETIGATINAPIHQYKRPHLTYLLSLPRPLRSLEVLTVKMRERLASMRITIRIENMKASAII